MMSMLLDAGTNSDALEWDGSEGESPVQTMEPVGPIAHNFVQTLARISLIMGPYGSAKTTSCFQKIIIATMRQNPGPDGVRRSRGCVVRDTYDQLTSNVMEDFFAWFPKTTENFNGEKMKSMLWLEVPGFGRLYIEIFWRALGEDTKPEKLFKGMQLTWLWLNEMDTLRPSIIKFGYPRLGRYPAAKDGGCKWFGMFGDFNAPEVTNYVYDIAVNDNLPISDEVLEELQEQYGSELRVAFFKQPGGMSPDAENLRNLPKGYYPGLMLTLDEGEQRRFIHNEFGAVRNGQPVFPEFVDEFHVAKRELQYDRNLPLIMAIDGGATPAAVFGQKTHDDQLRVLAELVIMVDDDDDKILQKMGPRQFAKECRKFIADKFPDARIADCWADPATAYGDYEDEEDLTWLDEFSDTFKMRAKPAPVPGNRLTKRLEGVRELLVRDGKPYLGLLLSPACPWLRQGFNNGYVLPSQKTSQGDKTIRDLPDKKNPFGHVQDALQYLRFGMEKSSDVLDDLDDRRRKKRKKGNMKRTGRAGAGRK